MVSDLWRFSVGKIWSVSAAAIERGPEIAASSDSSTNLPDAVRGVVGERGRHTMGERRIRRQRLYPLP